MDAFSIIIDSALFTFSHSRLPLGLYMQNLFMRVILFLVISVSILLSTNPTYAVSKRILFIGNSYVAVNNLPNLLYQVAASKGDTLVYDSNTPGGMTLAGHCTDLNTLTKIQLGNWDYVVVQAQSQEPSFSPAQVAVNTFPFAKKLDSIIHATNPCAETIFYMTWGRKNGDAANCIVYPPVCTFEGMQQRLRDSYVEMCQQNQATCAPAGMVWKKIRDNHPTLELYQADESHPSELGSYAVACCLYTTLFLKSSIGASFSPLSISSANALTIQTLSDAMVLDSVENWQQYGKLPLAKYTYAPNGLNTTFQNTSIRAIQYEWNFGDGSPLGTAFSPVHNFTTPGTYTVTLTAKNGCGTSNSFQQQVIVSNFPTSISNEAQNSIAISYANGYLSVLNPNKKDTLIISNVHGQNIMRIPIPSDTKIQLHPLPKGIYLYQVIGSSNTISGKFSIVE